MGLAPTGKAPPCHSPTSYLILRNINILRHNIHILANMADGPRAAAGTEDVRTAAREAPSLKSEPGPRMMLGNAAKAGVRLIVWCRKCQHQLEPDPAEMAARYGADVSVIDWKERLICSRCGGREVDMVVTGTEWR